MLTQTLPQWPVSIRRTVITTWRAHEAILFPLTMFLVLRIITEIVALTSVQRVPQPRPDWLDANPSGQTYNQALPPDAPLRALVEPWHRYDTAWYVKIAIQGYIPGDAAIAFPPLYPLSIRLLSPFVGDNYVLVSLLISNIACAIAFVLLFRLILIELGEAGLPVARRTLIYLCAFPTAYYLVGGYTEAPYLALTLGAFIAALNRRWWLCGLLAMLSALVRLQGATLCLPLAWIAYIQLRQVGWRALLARIPAVVGAPLGTLSYLAYLSINHLGTLDAAYIKEWQLSTRLPRDAINDYVTRLSHNLTLPFENDNVLALFFILITGIFVIIKLRPAYGLYIWSALFRYTLLMFPCFIALGAVLRKGWMLGIYVLAGTQWMFILMDHFIHWIWVA